MCVHYDTTVLAAFLLGEESVLTDDELSLVLSVLDLSLHDFFELGLTAALDAVDDALVAIANLELHLAFEQLDHSLHNHLLEGLFVKRLVLHSLLDVFLDCVSALLKLLVALDHLENAVFVCALRELDLLVDVHLLHALVVGFLGCHFARLEVAVAAAFELPLAHNLELEGLFVGLLAHEPSELERVCIVRH